MDHNQLQRFARSEKTASLFELPEPTGRFQLLLMQRACQLGQNYRQQNGIVKKVQGHKFAMTVTGNCPFLVDTFFCNNIHFGYSRQPCHTNTKCYFRLTSKARENMKT